MTDNDIKNAAKYAMKNRRAVEESASCGCYQCLSVMSTQDITDWTDWGETALCPRCGCDCLLAQTFAISLDEVSLKQIHDYWFATK